MEDTINRSARLDVRLRPHELVAVRQAAALERIRLSEFVRRVLTDAATRRLARAEKNRTESR